ncbi:unnamed protein product [Thelazia callipaeda]|uniref:Helicase ATP-binding domain-containing protein n=1 Tax=Thelazia callipaeda TaxID=103827 RepID=A0A0N5D022_THECL|nr:unnamed protein product [Thelazia callipaeda]
MVSLNIDGITVEFPFQPYRCQIKFMEKVMAALRMGQNAALESPTGTGKTLCLLCVTIAYLKDCKSRLTDLDFSQNIEGKLPKSLYPKILYASRTHSQLAQVIRELNKTTYKDIKTVTLASRDILCINEKVMKESNSHVKSLICRNLISKHQCLYYNFYEKADVQTLDMLYNENQVVPDIEEVISISRKHKYCPYFRNRTMYEEADLILLPYNYIVDPSLRNKHNISLKGNIVIFDEAHNLEAICEESTSVSFSTTQISASIRETKKALELVLADEEEIRTKMDNTVLPFGAEVEEAKEVKVEKNDVAHLLACLHQFEETVDRCLEDAGEKILGIDGKVYPGKKMIEMLTHAGFRRDIRESFSVTIDKIGRYLTAKAQSESLNEQFVDRGINLQEFSAFISTVFADKHASGALIDSFGGISSLNRKEIETSNVNHFQLYVTKYSSVITLNYWCFSPSVAMWYLHSCGVRSIIVTSGTLSPLDSFINNIGINVPITLENEHAADSDQILGALIQSSHSGLDLCGTFHKRSSAGYIYGIGDIIIRACQIIPHGILVFFPSYVVMNSCLKFWKTAKYGAKFIWETLTANKEAFIEPKSKSELKVILLQFREKVKEGRGAVLFAVCRAKVSEGIDFSDNESRGVIVIGIPFAPTTNPRIELKKRFLTKQRIGVVKEELKKFISADEWYQVDAIRGVNQSIGRVLRHKDDFGVVILVDSRFCSMPSKRFPSWMRSCLKNYQNINLFESDCINFFKKRNLEVKIYHSFNFLRMLQVYATQKLSSPIEITSQTSNSRKRNEIWKCSRENQSNSISEITTLYSSEAIEAFEKSIEHEKTVPKPPKRSCIFDDIENVEEINNIKDEMYTNNDNAKNMPSCSAFPIKKPKSKFLLKPNASSLIFKGSDEDASKKQSIQRNSPSEDHDAFLVNWQKPAAEYNKLLQSIDKPKSISLKKALISYAQNNNFRALISVYQMETLPHHVEIFKGKCFSHDNKLLTKKLLFTRKFTDRFSF